MADYEELEIVVWYASGNEYDVRAQGTFPAANQRMDLDRDSPELRKCLAAIRSGSIDKESLRRCGSFLFRKLFWGRVRDAYDESLKAAQERKRSGVRIKLDFAANAFELYELPWTALYDPERDLWLGVFNRPLNTPLSVSVPGQPPLPPVKESPLRILVVGASPPNLPPLEVREEAQKIEKVLADRLLAGAISTQVLTRVGDELVTRRRFRERIQQWKPHILHFVGHGPQEGLSPAGVYLEAEDESTGFYLAEDLQDALQLWGQNVRLVVLSACNTALAARQLASKGIPAIGMAAKILGPAAVSFAHGFYEALITEGLPLDDAVNRARSMVRQDEQGDECGWISPMLFLPQGKSIPLVPPPPKPPVLPKPPEPPPVPPNPPEPVTRRRTRRSGKKAWLWVLALLGLLLLVLAVQHLVIRWHRVPPEMVRIPAGAFKRGGESTPMIDLLRRYRERVKLRELLEFGPERGRIDRPFFMDVYEVTNGSYSAFLRSMQPQSRKDRTPATWDDPNLSRSDQPVASVDAEDAEAYCRWAGKRLPTSDEWERAARGTDGRLYPWGNQFHKDDANTGEGPEPHPVKGGNYSRDRSPEGIFDLGGNVSEWTASVDDVDGTAGRAVAGASWADSGEIYGLTFLRRATTLGYRGENLGFRCVRTMNPGAAPPEGMVLISAGEFAKGGEGSALLNLIRHSNLADSAIPALLGPSPEQAWLGEFLLDRHEVTNREYGVFLRALAANKVPQGAFDKDHTPAYWQEPQFNQPDQPVVGVDWHDADAYCRWVGKRLPTAREWERAARSTAGRRYPWGNEFDPKRCNTAESLGEDQTSAVASHPSCVSPEGVFDLVGNADEWTADKPAMAEDIKNPRVLRGGGWSDLGELRGLAYLDFLAAADYRGKDVGFRCAKTPHRSWLENLLSWLERRRGRQAAGQPGQD